MAAGKEIKSQIDSIKNTQKITSAMQMVAVSKMRRSQERMAANAPYARKIREVCHHTANANLDYRHPYLVPRNAVKRVGYIVVTSDQGLCGGLNVNLFKAALQDAQKWRDQGVEVAFCTIGRKGSGFFKKYGGELMATKDGLGDAPSMRDLIGSVKVMLDAYDEGKLDRLVLISNQFVNTMTQSPVVRTLLPVESSTDDKEVCEDISVCPSGNWIYLYEPDARTLLDTLLVRYVESQVYQAVIENIACEQAARMIAMRSATDNAGELMNDLQMVYNKARQAAITQEISEIVGGAAAV